MAAAVKALNAKIRSNPYTDYFCSTHFWGPASNFGIPMAAIADARKDPEIISGRMTVTLACYSAVFMRYSFAVTPVNYLLFGCHFINFGSQSMQGYRYLQYWNWGGREKVMEQKANQAKREGTEIAKSAQGLVNETKAQVAQGVDKVKSAVGSK